MCCASSCILGAMLSTIFLAAALSQPPKNVVRGVPVKPFETPTQVYTIKAVPGDVPPRLPQGFPTELQQQFHKNYRRDDQ